MARALVERHPRRFPREMSELTALPGVGRKTANVVLSVALGLPGLPVDTHVLRLSRRLGLTSATDPEKVEADLDALYPADEWGLLSLRLILHGRRVCLARKATLLGMSPGAAVPLSWARFPRSPAGGDREADLRHPPFRGLQPAGSDERSSGAARGKGAELKFRAICPARVSGRC